MRILSGVQPSGKLHLGNYFGAIQQHVQLQDGPGHECYYFIADYHALTTTHDRAQLRENVHDVAVAYLALGLDPKRTVFYRQSDVPEVQELAWMLASVTGVGLLERAHSYKDKVARGIVPRVGLFYYPVLMAADILMVDADLVPVGQDQVQHVEMTQDMAQSFNAAFDTEALRRPEWKLSPTPKVQGTDGEKMSKSYGNTIEIFAEGKPLKKSVMGVVTRPIDLGQPLPIENDTVLALYRLFASEAEMAAMEADYRAGSIGYGDAKKQLLARIDAQFAPARERRNELLRDPSLVEDVLSDGARRAREVAHEVVERCREATGLLKRPV
ncbi:tryptophan--tRNA ligase [bacterium]|nr:MAG: tryptophan--tRNA ligase [bacterium]RKZ14930.1 MAG: tryptophan--tRNA ligase [bacterium]